MQRNRAEDASMGFVINQIAMVFAFTALPLVLGATWLSEVRSSDEPAFTVRQYVIADPATGGGGYLGELNGIQIDPRWAFLSAPGRGCTAANMEIIAGDSARVRLEGVADLRISTADMPRLAAERYLIAEVCAGEFQRVSAGFDMPPHDSGPGPNTVDVHIERARGQHLIRYSAREASWQAIEVNAQRGVATGEPGSGGCIAAIYDQNTDVMTTVSATLEDVDFCIEIIEGVVAE